MNRWRNPSLIFILSLTLAAPVFGAHAKPAKPPAVGGKAGACGLAFVPLAVGNYWTYKSNLGKVIIVKILDIGQGKDFWQRPATTIDVEETYDARTIKSQWTCTPDKGLVVPLESFFFSSEPGGGVGAVFSTTSREQVTLEPDAALVQDANWVEVVKADVTRPDTGGAGAQHPPAKVEVERHVIVHAPENVVSAIGQWNALKITVELRGRAMIGEDKLEIPAKAEHPGTIWLVKGMGIVRLQDNFDKQWDLIESNLLTK